MPEPQITGATALITGASRVEQLHENLGALDVIDRLTPAVMERIDTITGV